MRNIALSIILICLVLQACNHNPADYKISRTLVNIDSLKFKTYADTIICDMVVKNPDKDDAWMGQCLNRLQRKAF